MHEFVHFCYSSNTVKCFQPNNEAYLRVAHFIFDLVLLARWFQCWTPRNNEENWKINLRTNSVSKLLPHALNQKKPNALDVLPVLPPLIRPPCTPVHTAMFKKSISWKIEMYFMNTESIASISSLTVIFPTQNKISSKKSHQNRAENNSKQNYLLVVDKHVVFLTLTPPPHDLEHLLHTSNFWSAPLTWWWRKRM